MLGDLGRSVGDVMAFLERTLENFNEILLFDANDVV